MIAPRNAALTAGPHEGVGVWVGRTELVTAATIARRLGVSSEMVRRWRLAATVTDGARVTLFPPPAGVFNADGTGPPLYVWRWAPVRRWAEATGRLK